MSKFGKKTSDPPVTRGTPDPKRKEGGWFKENQHSLIIAAILLLAFVIRFVFAYGLSAGSGFALSGGTSASEHLHTITEIITAGTIFGADGAINYPFGTASTNPPLLDFVLSLFAFIFKAAGMEATAAAGAALGLSAVIFGTLACIPMYLLGTRMLGSRKAGYLAALFLALCPIAISQTVFSNGTDIAFIAFMFLYFVYFLYKGVELIENPVEGKSPMKYSYIAGLFLAVIALSYADIRPILVVTIMCMAVAVIINRFRSKDAIPVAMFFSVPVLCGAIAGAVYFVAVGLLSGYIGIVLNAVFGVVLCMSFAALQKTPWTVTIPAYVIATIAIFVVMAIAVPEYLNMMLSGVDFYTEGYGALVSSSVSLSSIATDFGFVTMWFGLMMVIYRLFRIGKNIGSATYVFILVWMIVGMIFGISSSSDAVIFAPTFAIGFAAVMVWLFSKVDLKAYAASFKGQDIKSVWKKVFKPVPFLTVLAVVLLICVPNVMYALDAGTANNDTNNPVNANAIGYYVKTDSDWIVNSAFSTYSDVDKEGALVTWMDYSYDAATFGGFDVITNSLGGGSTAMSNILLANGSDGSSIAAMMIYLVRYNGVDASKTALTTVMSEADYTEFKAIMDTVTEEDREEVLGDTATYGILQTGVSDENIVYLRGINYLKQNYSSYQISMMYEALETSISKDVTYVMVSGSMFPMYYGYSSIFSTMAYMNGYAMSDSYGTVAQFLKMDYYTQYYTGTYAYTDSMYNTLLWRAYIGMSPSEAGLTGTYDSHLYLQNLMLSDGTYKATPGYGLGSFEVDYDHYYVKYNPSKDATLSSDGWEKMLYNDAIDKQASEGGLINYLSGYPVFIKYVKSTSGTAVSGKVFASDSSPVKNVRVAVTDENGLQRSTVFTNDAGEFTVMTYGKSTITYSVGTTAASGGTPVATVEYTSGSTLADVTIPATSLSGKIDAGDVGVTSVFMKLAGKTTDSSYDKTVTGTDFSFTGIVPDTYEITVMDADGKVTLATKEYLTVIGENNGLSISLKSAKVTVTVKDEAGNVMSGIKVALTTSTGLSFTSDDTDEDGVTTVNVAPGTYMYSIATDGYATSAASLTIEADKEQTAALTAVKASSVTAEGYKTGIVSAIGYQSAFANGSIKYPSGTAASPVLGIYANSGTKVYLGTTKAAPTAADGYVVSGKLLSSSSSTTGTSGWVAFIDSADSARQTIVSSGTDGYSILLPAGSYTVYATDNTNVYYGVIEVTSGENTGKDFVLSSASTVSGYTYWYSSSYKLAYMPLDVTVKSGDAAYRLNVVTGADGAYKFLVPSDATYTIKSDLKDSGVYYYTGEGDTKVYSKTIESAGNFTASVEKITIKNGNEYKITVSCGGEEKELAAGAEEQFPVTSTSMTVKASKEEGHYYNGTIGVEPAVIKTITLGDKSQDYTTVNFTVDDGATLTITSEEADAEFEEVEANKKYYFRTGYVYNVKAVNDDKSKVAYADVDLTAETPVTSVTMTLKNAVSVKGYVGYSADGTLTVNGGRSYEISSGSYDILIPEETTYTFKADVSNDTVSYSVEATPTLKTGEANLFNMSVIGGPVSGSDDSTTKAELTLLFMTDVNTGFRNAELKFSVKITAPEGAPTYVLTGGSAWRSVSFFSDADCTKQITSVNGSVTVYGKGTILSESVGECADGLTVVVKDVNGEEICTGKFTTSENWSKTTINNIIISHGTNVINYAEYQYAVKIENKDNFAKTFNVTLDGTVDSKWIARFVFDDKISAVDGGMEISVPGYATKTVYVKLTSIDGSSSDVPEVKTKVTVIGDYKMEASGEGITISGNTATVVSDKTTADVSIDLTASGRGMVTDKGSMPVYIWAILAAAILLVILIVWLGMRRGVFTRRK